MYKKIKYSGSLVSVLKSVGLFVNKKMKDILIDTDNSLMITVSINYGSFCPFY